MSVLPWPDGSGSWEEGSGFGDGGWMGEGPGFQRVEGQMSQPFRVQVSESKKDTIFWERQLC